jgi:hypothetical protein
MKAKTRASMMERVKVLERSLFIQVTALGWVIWYPVLVKRVELMINSFSGSYSVLKNNVLVLNNLQLSE